MRFRSIVTTVTAVLALNCSSNSTGINGDTTNNPNTNGSTSSVAQVSRYGPAVPPVQKGIRSNASDVFWMDPDNHEQSFLSKAHGKIGLFCVSSLQTVETRDLFDLIDSVQDVYGPNNLITLRVLIEAKSDLRTVRDTVSAHNWHGQFVVDTSIQILHNYAQSGSQGIPYTAIIDREGRIFTWRLNQSFQSNLQIFKQMIDSVM
jgi:hypothetical protein